MTALASTCTAAWGENDQNSGLRTCRILFLDKSKESPDEAYVFDGADSQKVTLSSLTFSKVITFSSETTSLTLSPNPVKDIETLPSGLPKIEIPDDVLDFYLLVFADEKNTILPVRLDLVDTRKYDLEAGKTLWINLSDHNVSAELGSSSVIIPAGEKAISSAPLDTHGYHPAVFKYQRKAKGELLPVMKKSWWFDANSRYLGIIKNSARGLPKIYSIRDRRKP